MLWLWVRHRLLCEDTEEGGRWPGKRWKPTVQFQNLVSCQNLFYWILQTDLCIGIKFQMSHDQWNSVFCATHSRDHRTWKLTQFQKLDFDEHNTLSSLTENNLIGRGGSGTVYRITNNCSGELLAVKRICNNYRRLDHKVQKQFISEVEILGTIRHSNIVKLFCCISNESSSLLLWVHGEAEFG